MDPFLGDTLDAIETWMEDCRSTLLRAGVELSEQRTARRGRITVALQGRVRFSALTNRGDDPFGHLGITLAPFEPMVQIMTDVMPAERPYAAALSTEGARELGLPTTDLDTVDAPFLAPWSRALAAALQRIAAPLPNVLSNASADELRELFYGLGDAAALGADSPEALSAVQLATEAMEVEGKWLPNAVNHAADLLTRATVRDGEWRATHAALTRQTRLLHDDWGAEVADRLTEMADVPPVPAAEAKLGVVHLVDPIGDETHGEPLWFPLCPSRTEGVSTRWLICRHPRFMPYVASILTRF